MQTVTEEDLFPYGWVCEACDRPFVAGETAYGVPLGVTSLGDEIEGDYRCGACWLADAPVVES